MNKGGPLMSANRHTCTMSRCFLSLTVLYLTLLLCSATAQDEAQTYSLVGVSGTLQEGFELRHRLDYTDNSCHPPRNIPAILVGKALVRGYKAYLDVKPAGWREYQPTTGPPRLPNPVLLPTGCYHDANIYWVYLVAPAQVLSILAGEPRFLSITPDTGLVDLTADETSDALRRLARHEINKKGCTNKTAFALPLVTGVWFDTTSFVESPVIDTLPDGTRVTTYDASLAEWAGVHLDDLLVSDNDSTAQRRKGAAWEKVYGKIRSAEVDTTRLDYPVMCHEGTRLGVSADHLRLNYPLTLLDIEHANVDLPAHDEL